MSKRYRKIVVGGAEYTYKIGRCHVDIRMPDGSRKTPDFTQVTGLDWRAIERAQWKRYLSITPKQIQEYIERIVDDRD